MKEMLVMSMSHTLLTCQHENFSLLLLPQQETRKRPNADKPITGQDAVQKPLLGYRWTTKIRATTTAWTGQMVQGWQAPTHTWLERASAGFLNSGLLPGSLLPSTHSNHSSSSYLGHWGWNSLTTPTCVGLAVHNTATLVLLDTDLCVTGWERFHSSWTQTSTSPTWVTLGETISQSSLISQPKLYQSKPCPVHFSHCLGKKQGRNNRENRSHPGSNLQEHFSPKTSSISVSVLSQKGTVPDLELFNYFVLSLHSVSSTSVSMYWFQITLYIYLFIYIFIYNLYQNW